jgi:hypothetical protein
LFVNDAPERTDLFGKTKCIDFTFRELPLEPMELIERSGRFCNLNTRCRLYQQSAVHIKDEQAISDYGKKSLFRIHNLVSLKAGALEPDLRLAIFHKGIPYKTSSQILSHDYRDARIDSDDVTVVPVF